jgi:predicted GIY-YIG superfamily endonuclease
MNATTVDACATPNTSSSPVVTETGAPDADADPNADAELRNTSAPVACGTVCPYGCYILASCDGRRTYVGVTHNLAHRLRQHNGALSGGAKATKAWRPWCVIVTISGFRTRSEALMFEWAMHHVRGSGGIAGRRVKLEKVLAKTRWTRRAPPARDVPLRVTHHPFTPPPPVLPP